MKVYPDLAILEDSHPPKEASLLKKCQRGSGRLAVILFSIYLVALLLFMCEYDCEVILARLFCHAWMG